MTSKSFRGQAKKGAVAQDHDVLYSLQYEYQHNLKCSAVDIQQWPRSDNVLLQGCRTCNNRIFSFANDEGGGHNYYNQAEQVHGQAAPDREARQPVLRGHRRSVPKCLA